MTLILRLFADVVGRMYSKTIMMMIQKAWYHPLVLLRMQCCPCQWHANITGWNQLWCLVQKRAMQKNSSGIGCFTLHQKKKKILILITFNFAPLTNSSWIHVLKMSNILYVQWTGMRLLMHYPLTSSNPWCSLHWLE